jgi:3-deoxy-7-phosphoheptulonate synthase
VIALLHPDADAEVVRRALTRMGLWVRRLEGGPQVAFAVEPPSPPVDPAALEQVPGVAAVLTGADVAPRAAAFAGAVQVGELEIGGGALTLIAGPCAVEDELALDVVAGAARAAGACILRGGAFKPRTSPYAFQGLGREGLRALSRIGRRHGLAVVSEVLDPRDAEVVAEHCDLLQVGSRNMQNTPLLKELAGAGRPVLLKRGMAATLSEWLQAAEYLLAGAPVVLCERGVRGFDPACRNLLDLAGVAAVRRESGLPVLVDPSHAVGRADLVCDLARAAVAAGADGVMVECHADRAVARSDGPQAIDLASLGTLGRELAAVAPILGRTFPSAASPADGSAKLPREVHLD